MTRAAAPASTHGAARLPEGRRLTSSDAEPLPLTANRLPQVAQLGFDDIGHAFARRVERISELFAHGVHRHAIPQLATALGSPPRAAASVFACPSCRAHGGAPRRTSYRRQGPPATRPTPHQQRRACSNDRPEERGRQQVVLLITLAHSFAV